MVWQPCHAPTPGVWQSCHALAPAADLKRLGEPATRKWRKHPYMQPCFCSNPMVLLYLNCFNKMKRWWSPSTHAYIFSPSRYRCIFPVYFYWKAKESPQPKVKILCSKGLISIYTQPKRPEQAILSSIIFLMSNVFYEKDNFIINGMFSNFLW